MRIEKRKGTDTDVIALCRQLDAYLNELAGGEHNRAAFTPHNQLDEIHDAFVAYDGERPIGCACFKRYGEGVAEVKRVFVQPAYRGKGVSTALIGAVEAAAREQGYASLILETGRALRAAVGLYRKMGYSCIPNYGPYREIPESVCMEKRL